MIHHPLSPLEWYWQHFMIYYVIMLNKIMLPIIILTIVMLVLAAYVEFFHVSK